MAKEARTSAMKHAKPNAKPVVQNVLKEKEEKKKKKKEEKTEAGSSSGAFDVRMCVDPGRTNTGGKAALTAQGSQRVLMDLLNLELSLKMDGWIGTRRSNWSRLIDEMRRTVGRKPGQFTGAAHYVVNDGTLVGVPPGKVSFIAGFDREDRLREASDVIN